ncbi:DnaD domain protein [Bacillus toyonensis]|uniref:DnaD domain protein n=1 Tax=Bacillus toyonensis TaxID=155322 RepID=UPI000BEB453E|nr:DnaD domain protein [Bacillus toyonensis]PEB93444.1 replication protein [Bacillus toyonensis]PED92021.1 replication protein [Bacillus toyonensis]
MATFRVHKSKNYTTINNTGLRDERLSWKAKGILAYILSLPDDWVFYMEEISTHAKDGIDSLRVGVKELKKFGYVRRFPVKNEKGKITNWETIIYEVPQVENPHMEKPQVEVPFMENPILLSTKELSTKELSTNKQNTDIQSSSSIFSFYENNFGILNSFIAESISQWVNDSSEELVQAAMQRALKQQKKWNYAEGILKQWVNKNIRTLADVNAAEIEFKNKGKKGEKNNASNQKDSSFIDKYDFKKR